MIPARKLRESIIVTFEVPIMMSPEKTQFNVLVRLGRPQGFTARYSVAKPMRQYLRPVRSVQGETRGAHSPCKQAEFLLSVRLVALADTPNGAENSSQPSPLDRCHPLTGEVGNNVSGALGPVLAKTPGFSMTSHSRVISRSSLRRSSRLHATC